MTVNKLPVISIRVGPETLRLEWLDDYYTDKRHMTGVWRFIVSKGKRILHESAHKRRSTGMRAMAMYGRKLIHSLVYKGRPYV